MMPEGPAPDNSQHRRGIVEKKPADTNYANRLGHYLPKRHTLAGTRSA
jgi:hypothetical protein